MWFDNIHVKYTGQGTAKLKLSLDYRVKLEIRQLAGFIIILLNLQFHHIHAQGSRILHFRQPQWNSHRGMN